MMSRVSHIDGRLRRRAMIHSATPRHSSSHYELMRPPSMKCAPLAFSTAHRHASTSQLHAMTFGDASPACFSFLVPAAFRHRRAAASFLFRHHDGLTTFSSAAMLAADEMNLAATDCACETPERHITSSSFRADACLQRWHDGAADGLLTAFRALITAFSRRGDRCARF